MKLTVDFEARSLKKLGVQKSVGAWRYSEDPTTDVICLAVKVDNNPTRIWVAPWVYAILQAHIDTIDEVGRVEDALPLMSREEVVQLFRDADIIEAHNAEFERAMCQNKMNPQYGTPEVPIPKWRCSQAKCLYHALPAKLADVGSVLGLVHQKDKEGKALIRQLCSPLKWLKKQRQELEAKGYVQVDDFTYQCPVTGKLFLRWNEDPEKYFRLVWYCIQDVETEHDLSCKLRDLPDPEQQIWAYDQLINSRGVRANVQAARIVRDAVTEYKDRLRKEAQETYGIENINSDVQFSSWLLEQGIVVPNTQKQTLIDLVADGVPPYIERAIYIRSIVSKAATSKLDAMLRCACSDDRIRGLYIYHKAATGRWAGSLLQPQNLPRASFKDPMVYINALIENPELAEMFFGDPVSCASKCVRGLLIASEGYDLCCADYSSIEGRVLAWIAGDEGAIDVYNRGLDAYKYAASSIYNSTYDQITKDQRQIGKVAELACGYQGSVGAFHSMAQVYGVKVPDEEAAKIVQGWRAGREATVNFWYRIEAAARKAVQSPGTTHEYRGIKFCVQGAFLLCRLPSGRLLHYFRPRMETGVGNFPDKETIVYEGMKLREGSTAVMWTDVATYGGKLTENIVQAISRDIEAAAIVRVENARYPIIMHTHDELVTEILEGWGSVEELEHIMSQPLPWARGLPIAAEGWRGKHYRK